MLDARQRIQQADDQVLAAGIPLGQTLTAARALLPSLQALEPDPEALEAAQLRLLCLAYGSSAQVSAVEPGTVVLEIGRSLRLFGGLKPLLRRLLEQWPRGWRRQWAVAPTPLAAEMLARWRPRSVVAPDPDWEQALQALPLELLDARAAQTLQASGVQHLQQVLALPRAGLKRRCGVAFVNALDRLLGQAPDPRVWFCPSAEWLGQRHFEPEIATLAELAPMRQGLLDELQAWLLAQDLLARALRWEADLAGGGELAWETWPGMPSRDPVWLEQVSALQWERQKLPAAVRSLRLRVVEVCAPEAPQQSLLPGAADAVAECSPLWARLAARLGPQALGRPQAVDEHRPERAWTQAEPLDHGQAPPPPPYPRPLWLLPQPRPVAVSELAWVGPAERVETGWWDGAPMRRDYHQARRQDGSQIWVYREHERPEQWFLHGVFA